MESLYLLVPMALLIVFAVGALFLRAAMQGQFDDLDKQGRLPDED